MKNQFRRITAGILAMLMVISSPVSSLAEVKAASPSEATTKYSSPSNASYQDEEAVVDDAGNISTNTEVEKDEQSDEAKMASPSEAEEIAFNQSQMVDGVVITVTADKGVFPKGAKLKVSKVINKKDLKEIDEAVEEVREEDRNVASSNTFDIQILNEKGNEIEPDNSNGTVNVKFSLAEKLNEVLDIAVYHVAEATPSQTEASENTIMDEEGILLDGELIDDVTEDTEENTSEKAETPYKAEVLDTEITEKKKTTEVEVKPESFSIYVVEFTYGELQYVLERGTSVKLSEIQEKIGLPGKVTAASSSNADYITIEKDSESDDWTVACNYLTNDYEDIYVRMQDENEYCISVHIRDVSDCKKLTLYYGGVELDGKDRDVFYLNESDTYFRLTKKLFNEGEINLENGKIPAYWKKSGDAYNKPQYCESNNYFYGIDSDTTFTLVWENPIPVTFDLNGVEINGESRKTVYGSKNYSIDTGLVEIGGETLFKNMDKTLTGGKIFAGWKLPNGQITDPNYGHLYYPQTGDNTIYAQWSDVVYTVIFKYYPEPESSDYEESIYLPGEKYDPPYYTEYESNYGEKIFAGWKTDDSDTVYTRDELIKMSPEKDEVFKAVWIDPDVFVALDANGGILGYYTRYPRMIGRRYGYFGCQPNREKYVFAGWYTEPDGGTRIDSETIIKNNQDHTLYAHWKPEGTLLTITLYPNDGRKYDGKDYYTASVPVGDYYYPSTPEPLDDPYTWFDGWYTDKECTHSYDSMELYEDITLYAKWNGTETWFNNGELLNEQMSSLAGGSDNIKGFVRSDTMADPNNGWMHVAQSGNITMWFDETTGNINWYSKAKNPKIEYPGYMFDDFINLTDISGLKDIDFSEASFFCWMFDNCSSLKDLKPIEDIDTSSAIDMRQMFSRCSALTASLASVIKNWDISHVNDFYMMFYGAKAIPTFSFNKKPGHWNNEGTYIPDGDNYAYLKTGTEFNNIVEKLAGELDGGLSDIDGIYIGESIPEYNETVEVISEDTSAKKAYIYGWISNNNEIALSIYSEAPCQLNPDSSYMFTGMDNLKNTSAISRFRTDYVTDMSHMFENTGKSSDCLELYSWNTSRVKDVSYMFADCQELSGLYLGYMDTSSIEKFEGFLSGDKNLGSITNFM